jgi:hypothetical protein
VGWKLNKCISATGRKVFRILLVEALYAPCCGCDPSTVGLGHEKKCSVKEKKPRILKTAALATTVMLNDQYRLVKFVAWFTCDVMALTRFKITGLTHVTTGTPDWLEASDGTSPVMPTPGAKVHIKWHRDCLIMS